MASKICHIQPKRNSHIIYVLTFLPARTNAHTAGGYKHVCGKKLHYFRYVPFRCPRLTFSGGMFSRQTCFRCYGDAHLHPNMELILWNWQVEFLFVGNFARFNSDPVAVSMRRHWSANSKHTHMLTCSVHILGVMLHSLRYVINYMFVASAAGMWQHDCAFESHALCSDCKICSQYEFIWTKEASAFGK